MNLSIYLEKLYHKDIPYLKTNLGLTNTIYKANIDGVDVAIRVPNEDIHDLINDNEREILDLISKTDLDVKEIYYDNKTHIRITKWVFNAINYQDFNGQDKNIKAIRLIKKLHNYHFITDKVFDPYKMYQEFTKKIKEPLFNYQDYEYFFNDFNNIDSEMILCHNDLVSGNILYTENREYLIDYEYAGMNKPIFDLLSFVTENNIDDINERKEIFNEYYNRALTPKDYDDIYITEMMMHILWSSWANMLYESRKEDIYLEIFNDKISRFKKGLINKTDIYYK